VRHPANVILNRRAVPTRNRWSIVLSVVLHTILVASAILIPLLMKRQRPVIEFDVVTIVPIQALGTPEPEPEPEAVETAEPEPPRPAPPPKEAPPPARPSPKPAPEVKKPVERPAPAPPAQPKQRRGSAFGSATGSSPFGASGVGLDNPDFTYGYYVDQMVAMIGSHWARPPVAARTECVVHFRVARDGAVSDVRLVESSGNEAFDQAALRAVDRAAPLPPLPASFNSESLGVNLRVR
jgi:protein TonB